MKNIILIGCLLGGILLLPNAPNASSSDTEPYTQPAALEPSVRAALLTEADVQLRLTVEAPNISLQTVNGLSLDDDEAAVFEKKGKPMSVAKDELFAQFLIYEYPGMSVAFDGGSIAYVEISGESETVSLDGHVLPATVEAVNAALGTPDYHAEDGFVYERGEALLKLFTDPDTGELLFISYYHIATV